MECNPQLIDLINVLAEKVGIVIDWTQANVIPYITDLFARLIALEIVTSGLWCLMCLIIMIITYMILKKFFKLDRNSAFYFDTLGVIFLISCLGIVLPGCVLISQIYDIIIACVVPEKTIFDLLSTINIR